MSIRAFHFWSPTCGPCKVIKPAIEDLKEEFSQVRWESINTQNDPAGLSHTMNVQVVPTIVVIAYNSAGQQVYIDKQSGTAMANYYLIIRSAIRAISS